MDITLTSMKDHHHHHNNNNNNNNKNNDHLFFKEGWVMRKHLMKDQQQKPKEQHYWKLCYITLLNGQLFIQSASSSFSNRYCWGKSHHRTSSFISSPHLNFKHYWSDRNQWKLDYRRKSKLLEYDYHDKNFKSLGKKERIDLKHSLTHLISGGGGKRKHVLSLKLADGSSLLFEVSTIKKAREWEFIMNYWAGLQSKIPLEGSVTNLDYFGNHDNHHHHQPNQIGAKKEKKDHLTVGSPSSSSLLLSSYNIPTWEYPIATMIQSQNSLDDQLTAIDNYIQSLHDQLNQHQDLIKQIENNYGKSCMNKKKVINNWETKMQYLIYENIKFKTYYEVLSSSSLI
ncbi:unnamed protein product [Cunninghamella blakesleeana]